MKRDLLDLICGSLALIGVGTVAAAFLILAIALMKSCGVG